METLWHGSRDAKPPFQLSLAIIRLPLKAPTSKNKRRGWTWSLYSHSTPFCSRASSVLKAVQNAYGRCFCLITKSVGLGFNGLAVFQSQPSASCDGQWKDIGYFTRYQFACCTVNISTHEHKPQDDYSAAEQQRQKIK